jgi:hypothetical protein
MHAAGIGEDNIVLTQWLKPLAPQASTHPHQGTLLFPGQLAECTSMHCDMCTVHSQNSSHPAAYHHRGLTVLPHKPPSSEAPAGKVCPEILVATHPHRTKDRIQPQLVNTWCRCEPRQLFQALHPMLSVLLSMSHMP